MKKTVGGWSLSFVTLCLLGLLASSGASSVAAQRSRNKKPVQAKTTASKRASDTKSTDKQNAAGKTKLSRAEARRQAAENARQRRAAELERQQQAAEARRRAELARQAAVARERAANQTLRDETVSNIARDDTTGEDPNVRRAAIEALGNEAGTVVVMSPRTGQIYATVNQEWAVQRGFKPCSTVKLVTGLAGISEGVIVENEFQTASLNRGALNLTDSLAYSNNRYFQNVGGQVGFEPMMNYARELGLGHTTGVNLPNESNGRLPSTKTGFALNRMSSHGDDFEVTPMQLATLVSAIANGGNLLVPRVPKNLQEAARMRPQVRRRIAFAPEILRKMLPGMIGAVNYGTARGAFDATQTIAGKTGSCIGQGSWLGLFASVAPVADPHLAVVVVLRGSHARGKYAAAVAGKIYRALGARYGRGTGSGDAEIQYVRTPIDLVPRPRITPAQAAALDEGEEDAAESEDIPGGGNSPGETLRQGKKGQTANGAANGGAPTNYRGNPSVKVGNNAPRPVVIIRPTEVITRPAAKPAPGKENQNGAATNQNAAGQQRPRRVLTNRF